MRRIRIDRIRDCRVCPFLEFLNAYILALKIKLLRAWKQPKWPLMEEWINKMWYTYVVLLLSYNYSKKNKIIPFAAT